MHFHTLTPSHPHSHPHAITPTLTPSRHHTHTITPSHPHSHPHTITPSQPHFWLVILNTEVQYRYTGGNLSYQFSKRPTKLDFGWSRMANLIISVLFCILHTIICTHRKREYPAIFSQLLHKRNKSRNRRLFKGRKT